MSVMEEVIIEDLTDLELKTIKRDCDASFETFYCIFFRLMVGHELEIKWSHKLMIKALEDIYYGKKTNLIINVAPGSGKTLLLRFFTAWCFSKYPGCRFLSVSAAKNLAMDNSKFLREIVDLELYERLYGISLVAHSKAIENWHIQYEGKKVGEIRASSIGGQITGFRAGQYRQGFTGAILIDDPMKAIDAHLPESMLKTNRYITEALATRKAKPSETPIICIMQRLSVDDPSYHLLEDNGMLVKFEQLKIPALVNKDYLFTLEDDYRELIEEEFLAELDENGETSYWVEREKVARLHEESDMNRYVFQAQKQQEPEGSVGQMFKPDWWQYYSALPEMEETHIYADTAQKKGETNDYSVFAVWGLADKKLYLIDIIRKRLSAPELLDEAKALWNKHNIPARHLRYMWIEDKVSGTGLIQQLDGMIPSNPTPRKAGKLLNKEARAMDVLPTMSMRRVFLPEPQQWHLHNEFLREHSNFPTTRYDDMVDTTIDAVTELLVNRELWKSIGSASLFAEDHE